MSAYDELVDRVRQSRKRKQFQMISDRVKSLGGRGGPIRKEPVPPRRFMAPPPRRLPAQSSVDPGFYRERPDAFGGLPSGGVNRRLRRGRKPEPRRPVRGRMY